MQQQEIYCSKYTNKEVDFFELVILSNIHYNKTKIKSLSANRDYYFSYILL